MSKEIDYHTLDLLGIEPKEFRLHRSNLAKLARQRVPHFEEDSVLLIKAGPEEMKFDGDQYIHYFIQDPNFYYLTGCKEYKYYGMIDMKDDGALTLFVPVPDEVQKVFFRQITIEDVKKQFECDAAELTKMSEVIQKRNPKKIYLLSAINRGSGREILYFDYIFRDEFSPLNDIKDYTSMIYECVAELRSIKTEYEIAMYRWFVDVTVDAHKNAIKNSKPGMIERDSENLFFEYASKVTYCRNHAFEHIAGSGPNASILHYPNNDQELKKGTLLLMDMGARLAEYCSDITTTCPVGGKFSKEQKEIYDIVLDSNRTVIKSMIPGVEWRQMQVVSEIVILKGLQKLGIIKEGDVEQMQKDRCCYYFMPHGIGHHLGLECHDVEPSYPNRQNRLMVENNLYTVEPGIYFNDYLLELALADPKVAKYIDKDKYLQYKIVGGVRIEDDVLVTKDGGDNLSKNCPRTTKEIEEFMRG